MQKTFEKNPRSLVKYSHCIPIIPSRETKLWKDTATARAIGMPGTADVQRNRHQGRWEGRNANTYTTLTEIRRTDQETTETSLFKERAARHQVHQRASLPRNNLMEIIIHVCSKKYCRNFKVSLPKLAVKNNKQLDLLKKCIPASYFTFYEKQALRPFANRIAPFDETGQVGDSEQPPEEGQVGDNVPAQDTQLPMAQLEA